MKLAATEAGRGNGGQWTAWKTMRPFSTLPTDLGNRCGDSHIPTAKAADLMIFPFKTHHRTQPRAETGDKKGIPTPLTVPPRIASKQHQVKRGFIRELIALSVRMSLINTLRAEWI
jgi:hypothetical protein